MQSLRACAASKCASEPAKGGYAVTGASSLPVMKRLTRCAAAMWAGWAGGRRASAPPSWVHAKNVGAGASSVGASPVPRARLSACCS